MRTTEKKTIVKRTFSQIMYNVSSFYVFLYLFLMAAFFPFFLTWGYRNAGTDKAMLFRFLGLGLLISVLPCACAWWVCQMKKSGLGNFFREIPDSDWLVMAYLFIITVSYFCSQNQEEAFWGVRGWYIGFMTQIFYVASYVFISRFLRGEKLLIPLFAASAGISFVLGILNRFSIYPLTLEGATPSFIATLGNINWYCGYWSVFFPLAAGLFYGLRGKGRLIRVCAAGFLAVSAAAGAVQGSDSAMLVFAAVAIVLFCISCKDYDGRKGFYETLMVITGACQVLRLVRVLFPHAMNYDSAPADLLTKGNGALYVFFGALLLWAVFYRLEKKHADILKFMRIERMAVLALLFFAFAVFLFLLIQNTTEPGSIGALSEKGVFTFNERWGSSRGVTWTAGLRVFEDQTFWKKLIGLGPDSFAYGVYKEGSTAVQMVTDAFGGSRLTNAHNEWITVLVNTGILGLLSCMGFFFAKTVRFIKAREVSPLVLACGLALAGYMSHNLFSFQQVLNGPFVYIMMGIGEAALRRGKHISLDK